MIRQCILLSCVALFAVTTIGVQYQPAVITATAAAQSDRPQLPPTYIPTGRSMYADYCASCHGPDGKGLGPVAPLFRKPPPDLSMLTKTHGGVFPKDYVTRLIQFGPGVPAHGSSSMPVWGPIFRIIENYNEAAVKQRIENLCNHLESLQGK